MLIFSKMIKLYFKIIDIQKIRPNYKYKYKFTEISFILSFFFQSILGKVEFQRPDVRQKQLNQSLSVFTFGTCNIPCNILN